MKRFIPLREILNFFTIGSFESLDCGKTQMLLYRQAELIGVEIVSFCSDGVIIQQMITYAVSTSPIIDASKIHDHEF